MSHAAFHKIGLPLSQKRETSWRSQGFSLLEVTFSLGILSIALVSMLSVIPLALQQAQKTRQELHITLLSEMIFSDLETRGGIQVKPIHHPHSLIRTNLFPTSTTLVYYQREASAIASEWITTSPQEAFYTITITIEPGPQEAPQTSHITLSIQWPGGQTSSQGIITTPSPLP